MGRILIAEDDQGVLKLLEKRLLRLGYEAIGVSDGSSVVTLCKKEEYDLLLLDYRLPDMTSHDVIRNLEQMKIKVPFLIMTGFGDEAIAVDMMKLGAEDYLVKDSNFYNNLPNVLNRVMNTIVSRNRLKDADEKIREQASLLNIAHDAIMVIQADGRISFWNPACEKVFGYSQKEAIDSLVKDLLVPNVDLAEFKGIWNQLLTKGKWNGELSVKTRRGVSVIVSSKNTLVKGDGQNPKSILSINTDITDKKKLEDNLERVRKLETVGRLAGGLAHDFNNILASIFGYARLAQRGIDPESRASKDLDNVLTAANRAKSLVEQILTFSRNNPIHLKPVQVEEVIDEAIRLLKTSIPDNVKININIDSKLPPVLADMTQVHQVIMNLVINALHAMKATGGDLDVFLDIVPSDNLPDDWSVGVRSGPYLRLRVRDQGCGMTPETKDQLFDPFYTTKAEGEGTGIGLAVVHTIVSKHGGRIYVESELQKGSTFDVYLPAIDKPVAAKKVLNSDLKGLRVLLVDDDLSVLDSTRQLLLSKGFDVVSVSSGMEALEILDEDSEFALILSDQNMPGMKGSQIAQIVNGDERKIPFIIMTGYAEEISSERRESANIVSLIKKPCSLELIEETIMEVLSQ
jgi:PAS domain S-box-containing protein